MKCDKIAKYEVSNIIQFPKKYVQTQPSPFKVMSRKDGCFDGYRQTYDDGFQWDVCNYCEGKGCK